MSMVVSSATCAVRGGEKTVPSLQHTSRTAAYPACEDRTDAIFQVRVVTEGGMHIEKREFYERFPLALARARAEAVIEGFRSHPRKWQAGRSVAVEVVANPIAAGERESVVCSIPVETPRPAAAVAA